MGVPTGVASDMYSNIVWVADKTNRCIWRYDSGADAWSGQIKPPTNLSQGPLLGEPAGIATDRNGIAVWVIDATCACLRFYDGTTWDPAPYTPPSSIGTMSGPRGVATTASADIVYLVDRVRVWKYDSTAGVWSSVANLDSGIGKASGLAADPFATYLWVNDPMNKLLWLYDGVTWTRILIP